MTRANFIKSYDHINLFTITSTAFVRVDSVPMQRVFRSLCSESRFASHLGKTLLRITDIESLSRERKVVAEDLAAGGKYKIVLRDGQRRGEKVTEVVLGEKEEGG